MWQWTPFPWRTSKLLWDNFQFLIDRSFVHGTTNTAAAIQFASDEIFTGRLSDGDRLAVVDIMILITDGGSDNKEETYNSARAAKQRGIHIIAIGISHQLIRVNCKSA